MTGYKSSTEIALQMIRDITSKVKSDEGDIDQNVLHKQWHALHSLAIFALIDAEQFKCPTRIQLIMDISHELDDDALPVDFYKRLIRIHIEVKKSGNRRTRNQTRNAIMKLFFETLRRGFWFREGENVGDALWRIFTTPTPRKGGGDHQMKTGHGDQKYGFMQLNYEDALEFVAGVNSLSVKSVEKIVSKQIGDVAPIKSMTGDEDFARFLVESERRRAKILRDLDEEETPLKKS